MGARKKRADGGRKGSASGMQTSRALHESEEEYRSLIANLLDVVYVIKPDGTIIFVSPQISRYGYQPEELLSRNINEFIAPDYRGHVLRKFGESLMIEDFTTTDIKWQGKSGQIFWVEALGRTVYDDARRPLYQVGVVRDINERKRAEIALRESEEKFRVLAETSPAAICLFQDDKLVYYNPSAVRFTGYTGEELSRLTLMDLLPLDYREAFKGFCLLKRTDGSDQMRYEMKLLAKGGEEIFCDISVGFIDYEGKPAVIITAFDITERKQAEEALRESEEKYHSIIEQSSNGFILVDEDGVIVDFNPVGEQITGLRAADWIGKRLWDFNCELMPAGNRTPGIREQMKAQISDAYRTGFAPWLHKPLDITLQRSDGEMRTVQMMTFPMRTSKGAHFGTFIRDVTERKQSEEALRESEEKFRVLAETSSAGIMVYQGEQTIYVNNAVERMSGYTRDELLKMHFWDLVHPEFRELVKKRGLGRQRGEDPPSSYEFKILMRDGQVRWMECTAGRIVYQGRPAGIATFFDITERKRAEEALRENEIFLSNVFWSIQDGISVLDKDLNVIRVNHAMEKWYGHNMPLVGKKCYEAYHGRSEPCESCPSLRTIEYKAMQNEVVPLVGEIGPVGWVELYTFPLLDRGGNVIGIIEHVRDVTERMRTEEELKVAKQQADLYLDLMGHDINNMHQIALGYLELAQGMQADEGQRELLDKPIEVLQRSSRLIHNVRKLQRLREGVFQTQKVDVVKVLADLQRELGAVPGKTITLNLNGHEHCYVRANELLPDVFTNLVSNAIRHTGNPAEIIIDVDRVIDDGKPYHRVIVEDDGPGIPDDSKGRIFNRMHKGSARGMGLGLYLVKSLVESYGGRVQAGDRVPGHHAKGARFVVLLPSFER